MRYQKKNLHVFFFFKIKTYTIIIDKEFSTTFKINLNISDLSEVICVKFFHHGIIYHSFIYKPL
jgi:hypothetical protein